MNSDIQLFSKNCLSAEAAAREARHLQALRGPGIVPLKDAGTHGPALERAACSLADVLHERGPLPEGEVRAVGARAAAALARVHDAGIVHGDVKPSNLLLSHNRELWLADFDAACPADGRSLERFSPGRLPPGTPARCASDMAALALALVELATGILLDPGTAWRAVDLRRLGCSPALSAELSFVLGGAGMLDGAGAALSALGAARMFSRGGTGSLPAPAVNAPRADSTPTVEFLPARVPTPAQSETLARAARERYEQVGSASNSVAAEPASRWPPADGQWPGAGCSVAAEPASRWWQRLVASWRSSDPSRRPAAGSGVRRRSARRPAGRRMPPA